VGEGCLLVRALAFHQGPLGLLDQHPGGQRGLELLGQGSGELGLGGRP
jgi:hypothetical protein